MSSFLRRNHRSVYHALDVRSIWGSHVGGWPPRVSSSIDRRSGTDSIRTHCDGKTNVRVRASKWTESNNANNSAWRGGTAAQPGGSPPLFAARAPDDGGVPFSQCAAVANSCFRRKNAVGRLPNPLPTSPPSPSNCNCVAQRFVVRPRPVNRRHYPDGTRIRGQCQCAHSPYGHRRLRSARSLPPSSHHSSTLCACVPVPYDFRDVQTGVQWSQLVVVSAHTLARLPPSLLPLV